MEELRKLRFGDVENVITPYTAGDDTIIIDETTRQIKVNPEEIATQDDLSDVKEDLNEFSSEVGDAIKTLDGEMNFALIKGDSDKGFTHTGVVDAENLKFYGNSLAFKNARFINGANLFYDGDSTISKNGVDMVKTNHFAVFNGTLTANYGFVFFDRSDFSIPPGEYVIKMEVDAGESTIGDTGPNIELYAYNSEDTRIRYAGFNIKTSDYSRVITLTDTATRLRFVCRPNINDVYSNYKIWMGMYDNGCEIVDTEIAVQDDTVYNYAGEIPTGFTTISTMQHESIVKAALDSKAYIGEQMDKAAAYLSPEEYGAVGDGTVDDTLAVQSCINAAIQKGVSVRGFATYKTTEPIYIIGNNQDIFLNTIHYTGTDAALIFSGMYNCIFVNSLNAYDSTGAGFRLVTRADYNCRANTLRFGMIYGYTNAVEFVNRYSLINANKTIYYNRFYCPRVYARNGHCFYLNFDDGVCNENHFYGADVSCPNGWVVYHENSESYANHFYGLSIESDCKNGAYGICVLHDCRTTECSDLRRNDPNSGTILKGKFYPPINAAINTVLPYVGLDVSSCRTYEQCLDIIAEAYNSGETKWLSYDKAFPKRYMQWHTVGIADKITPENIGEGTSINTRLPDGQLIAYFNKKGFVPKDPWYAVIDVSTYDTYTTDGKFPTIFDINQNVRINLDDSYCAVGINSFQVIQYDGKKATIYDKNGTLIFDGTQQTAGTYRLTCVVTPHTFEVEVTGRTLTYEESGLVGVYFGNNEKWTVEKLNIISDN